NARAVPGHPDVVEDRALDRWQADRQKTEHQAAGQREAELDVADREPRPDQLIELRASRLRRRSTEGALVPAERARGVTPNQLSAAEEDGEAVAVAAESAEHHAAHRDRERPEEDVAAVIDQRRGKRPGPDCRCEREPRAGAGERAHVAEQRV